MHYINEQNIFLFLVQMVILLGAARGLGELFRRWKQPPLTAEILVGIVLGPTLFGRAAPLWHDAIFPKNVIQQNMLETVGWLGVLFLLLETGLEIDFSSAWRQRGDALKIAVADIIIPMVVAFVACVVLPSAYLVQPDRRLLFALFMATVMTISAMPVAARALHDLNLSKTDLGFLIMSALSVNDIIGWLLFTLVLGLFTQETLGFGRVGIIMGATIGFTVFCLTLGRRLSGTVISEIKRRNMPQPATALTFICLLGMFCGAITQKIGIHALFGFFIAGVMAGQAKALSERIRQIISQMVYALFVPLFFAGIGLKIDFLTHFDWFLVIFVTVIGVAGRFLGAWLGVAMTALPKSDRLSVAVAHTPGGAMEIVVGLLALEYGLITQSVFIAIVFAAVFSCVILGPWLSYSVARRKKVSILEYFSKSSVVADIKAMSKEGALQELAEVAGSQATSYDGQMIYQAVARREAEMGTALEEGIAVPHARLVGLERALVVFGRSRPGIEWDSPDGKPTRLIFMVLTPQPSDVQVQILASIVRIMLVRTIREKLIRAEDPEALYTLLRESFATQQITRRNGQS
jgi:Kef-type K+ transport system membrane component KefB